MLLKYDPKNRLDFHIGSAQEVAIFVHSTAIQVPTAKGWKTISEEPRNEIWRLKPGVVRQICVERPMAEGWRLYINYAAELHGRDLFRANIHEAWLIRSFSNWNGKPWGGGKFGGSFELVSKQIFSE